MNTGRPGTEIGFAVRRVSEAPIVAAGAVPGYGAIFNAGVIHHDGRFHLFARGVRDGYRRNDGPGPRFLDYISDILVFTSGDGLSYDFQQVLARSTEHGVHCYEDPRVQRVGIGDDERVVMSYTNLPSPESGGAWRVGVHRLGYANGTFFLNRTSGRVIGPEDHPDKDAVLFNLRDGRVGLIHRIHPNMQLAVFDSLDDLWDAEAERWDEHMRELDRHTILRPSAGALGIGAGAPPVATAEGLLLFFHERERSGRYTDARLGALRGRRRRRLRPGSRRSAERHDLSDVRGVGSSCRRCHGRGGATPGRPGRRLKLDRTGRIAQSKKVRE